VTSSFQPELFAEPKQPTNLEFQGKEQADLSDDDKANKDLFDAHEAWKKKIEEGTLKSEELNQRFAGWYYVISSESFDKLHLQRSDLVKKKTS